MITLSLNFDKTATAANRSSQEKKIRELIDTHLTFPGSDKLKMGFNIKENGATSVSFTGPQDAIAEAKRLWNENVTPATAKVKSAATRVAKSANKLKKTAVKKVAAKKAVLKKAVVKRAPVRVKAKVTKAAPKKRKKG